MGGFGGGGLGVSGSSNHSGAGRDITEFDASQYDFFGKNVMEEVELGALEDDGDEDVGLVGIDSVDVHFSSIGEREQGEALSSLSDIDDLASLFSKGLMLIGKKESSARSDALNVETKKG